VLRTVFSLALLIGASALLVAAQSPGDGRRPAGASPFQVVEAGIREMQAAMASGRATSRALVSQYLMRIGLYEERLKAGLLVGQGRAPSGARAMQRSHVTPLHNATSSPSTAAMTATGSQRCSSRDSFATPPRRLRPDAHVAWGCYQEGWDAQPLDEGAQRVVPSDGTQVSKHV
jgi:hypothetical protein